MPLSNSVNNNLKNTKLFILTNKYHYVVFCDENKLLVFTAITKDK